jgi:DNA-binding SARP family transcriptional activator
MFSQITQVTVEEFRVRAQNKKVVLLYPWTTYRTLFMSHFISSFDKSEFLYYRISDEYTKLSDWLEALIDEFDQVLGGFGSNLRAALPSNNPAAIGEALSADLQAQETRPLVLFIDEFDRVPLNSEFKQFIEATVATLPDDVQLAFSSRRLTYQPWYDMVANGDAIVLGTESRVDDGMFTVSDNPRPQLEVYALGQGYAFVNGKEITNWDGALPQNLFFYFMDNPLVTRDDIFATFWPRLNVKEATNVFHVTKRKISERISMKVGDDKNYELTQYSAGFYTPSDKIIRHYDASEFEQLIETAITSGNDDTEETLLKQAITLYKAPFLPNINMEWVNKRRDELRQRYAQALISLGRLNQRREDLDHAIGYFTRSLKETPEREDIHRALMNIYLKQGRPNEAVIQYKTLEKYLSDTLGIGPSRETRALFDMVRSQI